MLQQTGFTKWNGQVLYSFCWMQGVCLLDVCKIIMNNSSNYDNYDLIDARFFVDVNVN